MSASETRLQQEARDRHKEHLTCLDEMEIYLLYDEDFATKQELMLQGGGMD